MKKADWHHDSSQKTDIQLEQIVPEYLSRNALVKWLFYKRLRSAAAFVRQVGPRALLDLGCGSGQFIELLNSEGAVAGDIRGLDINPLVTELNGKLTGCRFQQGTIMETGFEDAFFEAVVCLDVLEHIQAIGDAIAEIKRILSSGGHLITSEPVESVLYRSLRFLLKGTYSQESGPGAGKHYYNARDIDRVIRSSGFACIRSIRIPLPPPFDLFHVNLYRKQ